MVVNRLGSGFLKAFLLIMFVVMISVSFLYLYQYLIDSPHMKLREVDFRGVGGDIRRELIIRAGLTPDLSLMAIRLNDLKRKMEGHPWVRSVELERQFPHTLVVAVEKQVPFALVLEDRTYYMNRWGKIFKEVCDSEEMDFPVITGVSFKGPDKEKGLSQAAQAIRTLESEEGPWSLKGLSEVHINRDGSLSLYFNHLAAEIRSLGSDLEMKMEGLKKVAEHLNRTGGIARVTGIDLDCVDGAIVSFREG